MLVGLSASLFILGCGLIGNRAGEVSGAEAQDLIRRNIMLGEDQYPIEDPLSYQYGSVHVDGPSGGMLYRFRSTLEALEWIVEQHQLQRITIATLDELPLEFLEDTPRWWDSIQADPNAYYVFTEEFTRGGERQFIVVFNASTSEIYSVEHFSNMPGI